MPLKRNSGFCRTFRKVIKTLGFNLPIKAEVLQDIIYKTLDNDYSATIVMLFFTCPNLNPDEASHSMFNDSNRIRFAIVFDSWFTDRKVIDTGLESQLDTG